MNDRSDWVELRLMLEELCCDLCRFEQSAKLGCSPEKIRIHRELPLGLNRGFADIMIRPPQRPAFFVEVKFGYSDAEVLDSLKKKYALKPLPNLDTDKVVLVLDTEDRTNDAALVEKVSKWIDPSLTLEVWDTHHLSALLREHFAVEVNLSDPSKLLQARTAIDHAKGWHAFGQGSKDTYVHDPLHAQLMWNFGFWRLRHLRAAAGGQSSDILKPGINRNVAVLIADLCSFSSFVRDTPDPAIMRDSLASFYSKTRYEIINNGGMHYQFVGDQVVGLFGIPDSGDDFIQNAYQTARALCAIGKSVCRDWQQKIDRVQESIGVHIGLSVGDLNVIPLRPFSRSHQGFIGDCINMAARLMSEAQADQIIVSNSFHRQLTLPSQADFAPIQAVNAKNVGLINAWRTQVETSAPSL